MNENKNNSKTEKPKNCIVCNQEIPKKHRTYCSKKCRTLYNSRKNAKNTAEWTRKRRDELASIPSPDKIKCLICGRYYKQIGSHVYLTHKIKARTYREEMNLPVKKGMLPEKYRKIKAELAIQSESTQKNLEKGKKFRYKKGDERAIINTFYKGKAKEIEKIPEEIYPRRPKKHLNNQ